MNQFATYRAAREDALQCPTCGARQAWSDTCRRCKCDLTLLCQLRQQAQALRRRALVDLRDGHWPAALRAAHASHVLAPDATTTRLLAVCHFLTGDFPAALRATDTPAVRSF